MPLNTHTQIDRSFFFLSCFGPLVKVLECPSNHFFEPEAVQSKEGDKLTHNKVAKVVHEGGIHVKLGYLVDSWNEKHYAVAHVNYSGQEEHTSH